MEQPISLYLQLEPGQTADIEVVARAAIAFSAAIKEAAYILDPSLNVTVGFASGSEGSLSLNTIIKTVKDNAPSKTTLKAIAGTTLLWFANDVRGYGVSEAINHVIKGEPHVSAEEINRIAVEVAKINNGKVAQKEVRQVFRELQSDKTVTGVGATVEVGTPPPQIVPQQQFAERAEAILPSDLAPQKRTKKTKERVTLIAPVLLPRERRWKLYLPQVGEFGAKIKDDKFIDGILTGKRKIQMRAGIQMDVELETHEEHAGEVWKVTERVITRVIRVRPGASTADLFSRAAKEDSNDDE